MRVVAAVIVRELPDGVRRVLAGQRRSPRALAGRWEFPGGKVEPGEDDESALRREILEELGVHLVTAVPLGQELPMIGIPAPGPEPAGMWQPFLATIDAEPESVDHAQLRWLAADELDDMVWLTSDVPVLARVKAVLVAPPSRPDR